MNRNKKVIVISAINIRSGGTLTILRDCLKFISESEICRTFEVFALVHKKELALYDGIHYIEFPDSLTSWIKRIKYEYFQFKKISNKLKPYLWLSLHDMTPSVNAQRQAVYMHNPSIVNKIKLNDWKYDKTYILFALFYKYLYKINIGKNLYCIVQQNWFREVCSNLLKIPKNKIIVARPNISVDTNNESVRMKPCKTFFYPSFPRPFKNFETVCEAASILWEEGIRDMIIKITLNGAESRYSKDLFDKYHKIPIIEFCGLLSKEEMVEAYKKTDCLIFPSRLETWGLPISEFLPFNKPMILANEKYAYETSEGAKLVSFFDVNSSKDLADKIMEAYRGEFNDFKEIPINRIARPYARSYKELFEILLR